jgi:hypothetical protein
MKKGFLNVNRSDERPNQKFTGRLRGLMVDDL